ncbi:HAD family hydrolase [Jonesia quinghaiensis]|uniref:HAD family hydrolase n=1 Tax=Jonesia quinghaiensis TaxID=262806 RepID=UPI0004297CD9|nr:HAD-IA family hydrolase [Jonesia quinghaiensis]
MDTFLPTPGYKFSDRLFDAVLWDMDGTLISSIHVTEHCWGLWMQHYGYPPEHYHQFHGTPARAIVEQLLPREQWDEGFHRIVDMETHATDGIELMPGAHDVLAALPQQRRAIVTSSTRGLAQVRMAVTGIDMAVVVTADDVTHGKPNPEPYLRAAQLLGVDPARCVVVEDAPTGLAAGRAAGCATIAVPGTHALEELQADAYLQSLETLQCVVTDAGVLFSGSATPQ